MKLTSFSKLDYHQKQKQLKSPAKRIFLQEFKENVPNIRSSSQRVLICSALVFGLYRFIHNNISSSISASRNIILLLLSVLILSYLIFLFPRKPITTPQEFVVPWEKNICPWKSSRHLLCASSVECVSCKNMIRY